MSLDTFFEMVKIFGLPLTMSFVAVWAFYTRRIITRGEFEKTEAREREWRRLAVRGGEQIVDALPIVAETTKRKAARGES